MYEFYQVYRQNNNDDNNKCYEHLDRILETNTSIIDIKFMYMLFKFNTLKDKLF